MSNPSEIERLVGQIRTASTEYLPRGNTAERLEETTFVPIIGPTAVGKTTCMAAIEKEYEDFGMVRGFTTRPRREGEDPAIYDFMPHDTDSLRGILTDLEQGGLVQVAVHPTTGYVYGSDIGDFQKPFSMLDTLYSAMDDLHRLPFGRVREIGMVATPGTWHKRIQDRVGAGMDDEKEVEKRVNEGIASLDWLFGREAQENGSIAWVINQDGRLDETTQSVVQIVKHATAPDPAAREMAEDLKRFLESLRHS